MVRLRSSTLNLFAYALVTATLLFSLYSGYRAYTSFPSNGPEKITASRILLTKQDSGLKSGTISPEAPQSSPCPKVVSSRPRILSTAAIVHNPRRYHVLTTCQGFSNHWQIRIHYYWYALCHIAALTISLTIHASHLDMQKTSMQSMYAFMHPLTDPALRIQVQATEGGL